VLSAVLLLAGVALAVLAGLGLVAFPDVFSRMHAATKPATLGCCS
jgi:multicomponent Na+:H+ antiporter subunit G